MKNIIIFFILLISLPGLAQPNSDRSRKDTVATIQEMIRKDGFVSSSNIGFAGMRSRQWHRVAYLANISSVEELLAMTDDHNAALKIAAYAGLLQKGYPQANNVRSKLLRDNTAVSSIIGCIVEETTVQNATKTIESWYSSAQLSDEIKRLQHDANYRKNQFDLISGKKDLHSTKTKQAQN